MTVHVHKIQGIPPMETGAPLPTVVRKGDLLFVSYACRNPDFPGWEAGVSPDHPGFDAYCAVLKFSGVTWHCFGPPSDERLNEHPLYKNGLTFYGFHEIQESERTQGTDLHHWIITFHDETLEVTGTAMTVIAEKVMTELPADAIKIVSEQPASADCVPPPAKP